jgi:hypothetical protein
MKIIRNPSVPDISSSPSHDTVSYSRGENCKSFPQIDGMDSYVSIVIDIRYAMDDEIN